MRATYSARLVPAIRRWAVVTNRTPAGPSLMSAPSSVDSEQDRRSVPPCLWWSAGFAGEAPQVREARRWACGLFPSCDRLDEIAEIVSELAANAVKHTRSGEQGRFMVEVAWMPGLVRLVVGDQGSPDHVPTVIENADDDFGRGLFIVQRLASRLDYTGGALGRWVYADVDWPDGAVLDRSVGAYDAASIQKVIASQFRGTSAWWTSSARVWRAAPGVESVDECGLLEEPSPGALKGKLAAQYTAARVTAAWAAGQERNHP